MENKTFYWTYFDINLGILIPKKKGTGFLKSPIYHNVNPLSKFLVEKYPEYCTVCGLEGYLNIEVGNLELIMQKNRICIPIVRDVISFYKMPDAGAEYIQREQFFDKVIKNNKTKL